MASRKNRIPVVFDTNVVIGHYLSRSESSVNRQVFKLWRDRRELQLIVSPEMAEEYFEILNRIGISDIQVKRFKERLQKRTTVTWVNLGTRPTASRDSDDNLILATALVGKAKFLLSNDRDLLDIPLVERRRFKFEIVSPQGFLEFFANQKTGGSPGT
ncbi:MAG: putative toxin-antitoxin system toxin component, PIN family [Blastocatellia bacterium]|nr:putative toxin-antitoxin system toxin component, PIN family [Blastocatellia bacterium]